MPVGLGLRQLSHHLVATGSSTGVFSCLHSLLGQWDSRSSCCESSAALLIGRPGPLDRLVFQFTPSIVPLVIDANPTQKHVRARHLSFDVAGEPADRRRRGPRPGGPPLSSETKDPLVFLSVVSLCCFTQSRAQSSGDEWQQPRNKL
jgi:hypothetical protein